MEWIEELFVGGSIEDVGTVVYSLKQGIPMPSLYCICFFADKRCQLAILSSKELLASRYKDRKIMIAGIAQGRKEAVDLLLFLFQTAIDAGYDAAKPEKWIYSL